MPVIDRKYQQVIQSFYKGGFVPVPNTEYRSTFTRWGAETSELKKSALIRNVMDKTGWRKPSPYSLTSSHFSNWRGNFAWWDNVSHPTRDVLREQNPYMDSGFLLAFDSSYPTVPDNWGDRAVVEALNKLKSANVNYAVALAEARKSMGLIANTLLDLVKAYKNAKKGNWAAAAKALKVKPPTFRKGATDTAGRWLELQYGWLPLLSDVHGAFEDMQEGLLRDGHRVHVERTIKLPVPLPVRVNITPGKVPATFVEYKQHKGDMYGVKVRLDYTVDNTLLDDLSKIGFLNPTEVLWELVPFSFVIDWLLPIGNWISTFDAGKGLKFVGGSKTKFVRIRRTGEVNYTGSFKRVDNGIHVLNVSGSFDYFSMNRSVYLTQPTAVPYWKNPISTLHIANSIALVTAIFGRK